MLNTDRAWDDKGTGHVSCAYIDRLQGMALIVRSEDDERESLTTTTICCLKDFQQADNNLLAVQR